MQSKSIGIVCTSRGFGGLEINTLKLCRYLLNYGWRVRLLVNAAGTMYQQAAESASDITTVQSLGDNKLSKAVLRKWLSSHSVGILLTPYNKDIAALSSYKRWNNRSVKLVYQQHMQVGVNKRDFIHTLRYNMLDAWISPLEYLKQETISKTKIPADKIPVIPFGLEPDRLVNSSLSMNEARQQLQLPQDVSLIGVLGRVDPKKGQDFLIRALAKLPDHYHLLIVGDVTPNEGEEFLNHLHHLVKQNNLEERVHFRKNQKDISLFFSAIDIFAMPSHGETYGMVTLEAMLSGVPVIGVNRDGTAELLQKGKLGWLHELEDIDGFIQKLEELQSDPDLVDKLSAARNEVLTNYSTDRMMTATDQLLTTLL